MGTRGIWTIARIEEGICRSWRVTGGMRRTNLLMMKTVGMTKTTKTTKTRMRTVRMRMTTSTTRSLARNLTEACEDVSGHG